MLEAWDRGSARRCRRGIWHERHSIASGLRIGWATSCPHRFVQAGPQVVATAFDVLVDAGQHPPRSTWPINVAMV